jgi:Tol biopolymer transport system component
MKMLALTISVGMVLLISLACIFTTSATNATDTPKTVPTPVQDGFPKATATLALKPTAPVAPESTVTLVIEPTITTDHSLGHIVFEFCKSVSSIGGGMNCGISIMNADGSGVREITDFDGDSEPFLSPDGTRVVFVSSKRDGNYEIYLINTDGSGLTRLTNNPELDLDPTWSPDGSQIIYTSSGIINVMGVDGSNPHPLSNVSAGFPSWSPDGRQVLFLTGNLYNILNIMDANGSHARVIHTSQVYEMKSPVMSPDGSKIAFLTQKTQDGYVEVDVIDKDGKNQLSLTDGYQLTYGGLSWSPDGQQLIFTMVGDGKTHQGWPPSLLFIVNADGSGLHKLNASCAACAWPNWGQ